MSEPEAKRLKPTNDGGENQPSYVPQTSQQAPAHSNGGIFTSSDPKIQSAIESLSAPTRASLVNLYTSGLIKDLELEACCIESLRDFSDQTAGEILDKFKDSDLSTVRSKTAFFIGILKRFRRDHGASGAGRTVSSSMPQMNMAPGQTVSGMSPPGHPDMERALGTIPMSVRMKLELLFATGMLLKNDLEASCVDSLRDFDEATGCQIVDKFAEADFASLKSKTAFFIGILKRFRSSRAAGGPPAFPPQQAYPCFDPWGNPMPPQPFPQPGMGNMGMGMGGPMGNMGMGNMGGPMGNMGGPMGNMGGPMGNMGGPMGNMGGPMGNMGGPMGGGPPPRGPAADPQNMMKMDAAMGNLSPLVRNKVESMWVSGVVTKADLEACCMDSLKDFEDSVACGVIDKFLEGDMSTVRNKTAYFIGVLKRARSTHGTVRAPVYGGGNF